MKRIGACALLISLEILVAGCSSTPVASTASTAAPATGTSSTSADSASSGAAKPMGSSTVTTVALPPHLDPKSRISTDRSVYFDFDDFTIKQEHKGLIERQGTYLVSKPILAIKIEGNADDRGSAEYNLALGQKRAEAVMRALKLYGVKDSQMEAVSWGEERPKATGHDEASWAQNRRADLVYPKQ